MCPLWIQLATKNVYSVMGTTTIDRLNKRRRAASGTASYATLCEPTDADSDDCGDLIRRRGAGYPCRAVIVGDQVRN